VETDELMKMAEFQTLETDMLTWKARGVARGVVLESGDREQYHWRSPSGVVSWNNSLILLLWHYHPSNLQQGCSHLLTDSVWCPMRMQVHSGWAGLER
jgi:hypothetical protein